MQYDSHDLLSIQSLHKGRSALPTIKREANDLTDEEHGAFASMLEDRTGTWVRLWYHL
ncbi:MAG: hypothetical protein ABSF48_11800 [Thermodesulfobacteriota bacterium]